MNQLFKVSLEAKLVVLFFLIEVFIHLFTYLLYILLVYVPTA